MKKTIALLGTIAALALTGTAANATTVNIGVYPPADPFFFITSATPDDSNVTAIFGNTITTASTAFDDTFTFALPVSGFGSGSVSTSSSGASNLLTITDVVFNGVTYTAAQAATGLSGIPITAGVENTLEIIGTTGSKTVAGTFSGTATFAAAAVPEPATWGMMLLGLGMIGFAARRRRNVAFSYA